jgi:hypothetical protein
MLITFSPHLFDHEAERHLNLDYVEVAVRTGRVIYEKCELPKKICFDKV